VFFFVFGGAGLRDNGEKNKRVGGPRPVWKWHKVNTAGRHGSELTVKGSGGEA